jgi:hypothetical protein
MVHFKLTAAAAALLAPAAMGAVTCGATDKASVRVCNFGTSSTCADSSFDTCVNIHVGDCYNEAASKFIKLAVGTTGIVTISQYTDSACSTADSTTPSLTRQGYTGTMTHATDCLGATGAGATLASFGEDASDFYTYEVFCGTGTTAMQQSKGVVTYSASAKLDCTSTPVTAKVDGTGPWDERTIVSSTAGFCTRTGTAASYKATCSSAGVLSLATYGTKDCSTTSTANTNYEFASAAACDNGCHAAAAAATCYSAIDPKTATAGNGVIVKKGGSAVCTSMDNTVAPSPAPASPAGIASAALATVVGLGYLFF